MILNVFMIKKKGIILSVFLTLTVLILFIPSAEGVEIKHTYNEMTTNQTTTGDTDWHNVTGAKITSGNFTGGNNYLIIISGTIVGDTAGADYGMRTAHDGTSWDDSILQVEFNTDNRISMYQYFTHRTWVAGEDLNVQFRTLDAGATASADNISMLIMDLSDTGWTNNNDYIFNSTSLTGQTLTDSWDTVVTAEITPDVNSDYLVMFTAQHNAPDSTVKQWESRILSTGDVSDTQPHRGMEPEDLTNDKILQTMSRVYSLTASTPNKFQGQVRIDSATPTGAGQAHDTGLFILNLTAFAEHAFAWTAGNVALSDTDYATLLQTASITPTLAGNITSLASFASESASGSSVSEIQARLQVDNVDQPPTQTADRQALMPTFDATDLLTGGFMSVDSVTAAGHTVDVDGSHDDTVGDITQRSLAVWTMELSSAPPLIGPSWLKAINITTDAIDFPSTLTDYPLYANITSIDLGTDTQADCDDIIFTDVLNTTKLSHEIENCDTVNDVLEVWVKLPTASSTGTSFFMHYDNAGATNQQESQNVWRSEYLLVAHLNGTANDSTSNGYDGTTTGLTQVNSPLGDAYSKTNTSDNIDFGDHDDMEAEEFAISAWFKMDDVTGDGYIFDKQSSNTWVLFFDDVTSGVCGSTTDKIVFGTNNDTQSFRRSCTDSSVVADVWYHAVGKSVIGQNNTVTVNGIKQVDGNEHIIPDNTDATVATAFESASGTGDFQGDITELRYYSGVLSDDWITSDYECQRPDGDCITISGEPEPPEPPEPPVNGGADPLAVTEELNAVNASSSQINLSWRDPETVWHFAVLADYGTGTSLEQDVADLIIGWNNTNNIEFIITLGDNTYGASTSFPARVGGFYGTDAANWIGNQTFFPTPGNHDFFGGNLNDYLAYFSWLPPTENTSDDATGTYYDFIRHGVRLYSINTGSGGTETTLASNSPTGQWLQSNMTASTSAFDVVYAHHPPYTSGEFPIEGSVAFRWNYTGWGGDVHLTGHDHSYERIYNQTDGMTYMIQGLGGRSASDHCLTPLDGGCTGIENPFSEVQWGSDNGATLVTVDYDQMNFTTTSDSGAFVDEFFINSTITDITGYKIERRLCSGGAFTVIVADTGNNNTSYSDTGLNASTCYEYRVSAINSAGIGGISNTANATTNTAPPTPEINYNAIVLSVNSPQLNRLGGVFAITCPFNSTLTGVLTNGTFICTPLSDFFP